MGWSISDTIKGGANFLGNAAAAPFELGGKAIDTAGDAVNGAADWAGDRVSDVAHGDPFGTERRTNEHTDRVAAETDRKLEEVKAGQEAIKNESAAEGPDVTNVVDAELTDPERGALANHLVEEGDTISSIAQENGKSVDEILSLNPDLGDGNLINVGQEIKLSDLEVDGGAAGRVEEAAQEADTGVEADGPSVEV